MKAGTPDWKRLTAIAQKAEARSQRPGWNTRAWMYLLRQALAATHGNGQFTEFMMRYKPEPGRRDIGRLTETVYQILLRANDALTIRDITRALPDPAPRSDVTLAVRRLLRARRITERLLHDVRVGREANWYTA